MPRVLLLLCLLAALGGCKKAKPTATDSPSGTPGSTPGGTTLGPVAGSGEPKVTRPALPAGWVAFTHPEDAFSVYLPAAAQPKKGNQFGLSQPVPTGRAFKSDYFAQANGLYCDCGVMIYSQELVDGVRNANYPLAAGGKRAQVTWAGHPAVEDVSEESPGRLTVKRRVWVGNRAFYCNVYGQAAGRPTAEERAAVFDSFTVGK